MDLGRYRLPRTGEIGPKALILLVKFDDLRLVSPFDFIIAHEKPQRTLGSPACVHT